MINLDSFSHIAIIRVSVKLGILEKTEKTQ